MPTTSITISVRDNFDSVIDEARRINEDLDEAMFFATSENTDALHSAAVDTINKDRPKTFETVDKDVQPIAGGARGFVGSNDKIALILEDGSKAHKIRGNPFLRFEAGGRVIIRREVNHPGTKPYQWLLRAAEGEEPAMRERYKAAVAAVLGG